MRKTCILAAFVALGLASCQKDVTIPRESLTHRKDLVLTKAQADFIQSNNSFALNLFRQVVKAEDGKSLLISPLSVTIDFGMVCNGAVGNTQKEIFETLGYKDGSVEDLNAFCQTMMEQSAAVDPSTTLEIANAAVVNSLYPGLKDSFTNTVKQAYDAKIIYKNFAQEDIKKLIDDWCNEKTHGMIPELLSQPVKPQEYAHFLNAVYFKGIWTNKFKKQDTKPAPFTLENGSKKEVKMMHQSEVFGYGYLANLCTAVRLPYGNQAYRMTLLLPVEGETLAQLVESLDTGTWDKLQRLGDRVVDVKIPTFETEYSVMLKEALEGLGIRQAFDSDNADFTAMSSNPDLYVGKVLQKAKIKVDEEGSEAAAVTDIDMDGCAGPSDTPQIAEFHADRPFLYIISEISSGAIYFIGQYTGI